MDQPLKVLRSQVAWVVGGGAAAGSGNGRGRAKKKAAPKDFKAVLWVAADKLRAQMDAAAYKHLVLQRVSDPDSDFFIGEDLDDHHAALEDRDYHTQDNVFWVPAEAAASGTLACGQVGGGCV